MRPTVWPALLTASLALAACNETSRGTDVLSDADLSDSGASGVDTDTEDTGSSTPDSSSAPDAGPSPDSGPSPDAQPTDVAPSDTGLSPSDTGAAPDVQPPDVPPDDVPECAEWTLDCVFDRYSDGEVFPIRDRASVFDEFGVAACEVIDADGDATYEWSLLRAPGPSEITSFGADAFANIAHIGEWVMQVEVTDACGTGTRSVGFAVAPRTADDLVFVLDWTSADDPDAVVDADLDLFVRNAEFGCWQDEGAVCSYEEPAPDWGVFRDTSDDPALATSSSATSGPEIVRYPRAGAAPLEIGFEQENSGWSVNARLRVFRNGVLISDQTEATTRSGWVTLARWESGEIEVLSEHRDEAPTRCQ